MEELIKIGNGLYNDFTVVIKRIFGGRTISDILSHKDEDVERIGRLAVTCGEDELRPGSSNSPWGEVQACLDRIKDKISNGRMSGRVLDLIRANDGPIYMLFDNSINHCRPPLTFDVITEQQRRLLRDCAPDPSRLPWAKLREDSVVKSGLFKVISEMQIGTEITGDTRVELLRSMQDSRVHGTRIYRGQNDYEGSVARGLKKGRCLAEQLVASVDDIKCTELKTAVNREIALADRDRVNRVNHLADRVYDASCGLANLFAIWSFRQGMSPTKENVERWFKQWVVEADRPLLMPGLGTIGNLQLILEHMSRASPGRQLASQAGDGFDLRNMTQASFSSCIDKIVERAKVPGSTDPVNARLGIVQAVDGVHMFIIYRDIDGYWYTMDVYVDNNDGTVFSFGDRPAGGVPSTYSKQIHSFRLIVDS